MKKSYIFLAAAALVLTACSKENEFEIEEQQTPVDFAAFSEGLTRSTTGTNLEDYHSNFGVWTYKTYNSQESTVMSHFKVVKKVTGEGESAVVTWKYAGETGSAAQVLKYWDKAASNYTFKAYAPYNSTNASISNDKKIVIASGQYAANQNIQTTLATTINTGAFSGTGAGSTTASTDWMTASVSRDAVNNVMGTGIVTLPFSHILSKVIVKFVKSDGFTPKIVITSASISGLWGTGNYNGTAWTVTGNSNSLDCATGTLAATEENEDPVPYYALECLEMPKASDVALKFNVAYKIGDDNEVFTVTNADITGITSFASGYNYTITVTIGPNPIEFDATVSTWTNGSNGQVAVP